MKYFEKQSDKKLMSYLYNSLREPSHSIRADALLSGEISRYHPFFINASLKGTYKDLVQYSNRGIKPELVKEISKLKDQMLDYSDDYFKKDNRLN